MERITLYSHFRAVQVEIHLFKFLFHPLISSSFCLSSFLRDNNCWLSLKISPHFWGAYRIFLFHRSDRKWGWRCSAAPRHPSSCLHIPHCSFNASRGSAGTRFSFRPAPQDSYPTSFPGPAVRLRYQHGVEVQECNEPFPSRYDNLFLNVFKPAETPSMDNQGLVRQKFLDGLGMVKRRWVFHF